MASNIIQGAYPEEVPDNTSKRIEGNLPATTDPSYSPDTLIKQSLENYQKPDAGKQRLMARFGSAYSDEGFISGTRDIGVAFKLPFTETLEKKKELLKKEYGEQADIQAYDFGEDGKYEVATKDGKTWQSTEGLYQYLKDVPETVASVALSPSGKAGIARRIVQPALAAAAAKFGQEEALGRFYESQRSSPTEKAVQSLFLNAAGGAAGEFVLTPLIARTLGVKGAPGAERASEAIKEDKLMPLTEGQYTSNEIVQSQYKQWQLINEQAKTEALKRFQSLRLDGVLRWIDDLGGLSGFSRPEIQALAERASYEIDDSIRTLSSGSTPIGTVLPRLKTALDVFNKSSSVDKNALYKEAFDTAVKDGVELDFTPVMKAITEIEKGVPIETKGVPTASLGVPIGPTSTEPLRKLTPATELQRIIDSYKNVKSTLGIHNPDGDYVGALEQMNAMRREISAFAWENADNNQGRLANKILDAIDTSIENPITAATPAYKDAYKRAQEANAAWRSVLEIRKISGLDKADIGSYQSYVANLVKPGNGPVFDLMERMFKGTPEAMDDIRSTYTDFLVRNYDKAGNLIENLEKNDPILLNKLFPEKEDLNIVKGFIKDKTKYEKSWLSKQKDLEALSEGERALTFFDGSPDEIVNNVKEYVKVHGEKGRKNLIAAYLYRLESKSRTSPSEMLEGVSLSDRDPAQVIDATTFSSEIERTVDMAKAIMKPDELAKLRRFYDYAIQLRQTAAGLPGKIGKESSDTGTSLKIAEMGSQSSQVPATLERSGMAGIAKQYMRMIGSPRITAYVLGLDKPAVGKAKGRVSSKTVDALKNVSRVLPTIMMNDAATSYESDELMRDNVYTP